MLGAYEGLMKSSPQVGQRPAQSMGGQAMPAGYKETVPIAKKQALDIMKQMREIEAQYPDPNMDVLPEHAHHYSSLEQDLKQAIQSWEHGQGKAVDQGKFKDILKGGTRTRDLAEELFDVGRGAIPPAPGGR
jgi:hypothetical protein